MEAGVQPLEIINKTLSNPIMYTLEQELSGKLRNKNIVDRLQNEILNGQNIYDVVSHNGWNYRNSEKARGKLEDSAITAKGESDKHRKKFNDMQVFTYFRDRVLPLIRSQDKDRAIVTRLINNSQFEALKFLNALTRPVKVGDRIKVCDDILCIMFKKKEVELNGMDCFDK